MNNSNITNRMTAIKPSRSTITSDNKNENISGEDISESQGRMLDLNENLLYEKNESSPLAPHIFQLTIKQGEYVYAYSNDIVLIESCNHWVKINLAFADKLKKTTRHDSLKNFLAALPDYFIRLGRFCAVNTRRISGGNYNEQTFEFDFKVKIKLSHTLDRRFFCNIGK